MDPKRMIAMDEMRPLSHYYSQFIAGLPNGGDLRGEDIVEQPHSEERPSDASYG